MRLLPLKYKVVTATVDAALGEIGVIYQACGFHYVGLMTRGGRAAISINGQPVSERYVFKMAGTRGWRALAKMGFDVTPTPRKERYFAFRGSRREQRELRAAIADRIKPFPRRSAQGFAEAPLSRDASSSAQ